MIYLCLPSTKINQNHVCIGKFYMYESLFGFFRCAIGRFPVVELKVFVKIPDAQPMGRRPINTYKKTGSFWVDVGKFLPVHWWGRIWVLFHIQVYWQLGQLVNFPVATGRSTAEVLYTLFLIWFWMDTDIDSIHFSKSVGPIVKHLRRLLPYLTTLCGPGYRMDHLPLVITFGVSEKRLAWHRHGYVLVGWKHHPL